MDASSSSSSSTSSTRPGNHFRLLSAEEIKKQADLIIARSKEAQDAVAALIDKELTFDNVCKALAYNEAAASTAATSCYFPSSVSPDKDVRDASTEAQKTLKAFSIESDMREDVYNVLRKFADSRPSLSPEDAHLLKKQLEQFERNGLALPKEKRDKLAELKKRMSELCIQFQKNTNDDKTTIEFTKEELAGLPEDYFAELSQTEDKTKYIVSMKYPEYFPVVEQATNEETRRKINIVNDSRLLDVNVPILEEVVSLRAEIAALMGYETHGDYILEIRMAKSPTTVANFLSDLQKKLAPFAEKELQSLLALKQAEKQANGEKFDGVINNWDFRYYLRMLLENEYNIKEDEIKEYFPIDVVTKGLLDVYQELLGLRFQEVVNPEVWHPDVRLFDVYDATTTDFVGQFYLDMYPRDGKYTHAAAFPMQPTYVKTDGSVQFPVAAMVANFTKPQKDRPSLLKHGEVVTYFHEFGHIMHNICSRVKYSRFSGTSVERDFVEAPSQMLENWCYESPVLHRLSGHYQKPEQHLPEELVKRLIDAKNVCTGLLNLRQIFFGLFDQTIHSKKAGPDARVDTAALWHKLKPEIMLVQSIPGTNPSATFGHLAGGYDAQYYGYLYSEVFSADMYSRFKTEGVMSPALGKEYRDIVLSRGGSVDSIDSLREFLHREPTQDAFLHHLGLTDH